MHKLSVGLAAALLLGTALAIPTRHQNRASVFERDVAPVDPSVPPAIASGCKAHVNETDCSADKCCNWCGPKATIPVPVGWCMPVLPVATGLACAKAPPSCATLTTNETCLAEQGNQCKWIPTSTLDPANMGLCMYDWDMCKMPAPATPAPAMPTLKRAQKQVKSW